MINFKFFKTLKSLKGTEVLANFNPTDWIIVPNRLPYMLGRETHRAIPLQGNCSNWLPHRG